MFHICVAFSSLLNSPLFPKLKQSFVLTLLDSANQKVAV